MTDDDFVALMDAFDALDSAAQRVLVAQPSTMTEAAANLDRARLAMRAVIHEKILRRKAVA